MAATPRSLKIKTGACKRLVEELEWFEKELEEEAAKTSEMRKKGIDLFLKQQENILAELMVPDCRNRLEDELADLKATVAKLKEWNEQAAEIREAKNTINEVESALESIID